MPESTAKRECWLVIRVTAMRDALSEAETEYEKQIAAMRDGDVILARTELEILRTSSGGYNRTRW